MWTKPTIDDMRLILSQDEIDRLSQLSLDPRVQDNINKTIELVADTWRGALGAKGYTLDVRAHYIPDSYKYWILVHARWAVWTRFPQSVVIALDEGRKTEYEHALKLLKDPYIDTEKPDWEHDPSNPANRTDDYWRASASIKVPTPLIFGSKDGGNCWWN